MHSEMRKLLEKHYYVMFDVLSKEVPPQQRVEHCVEVMPSSELPLKVPHPLNREETLKQVDDLLDAGFIQPFHAPFGAPMLFVNEQDGSLRMSLDYRALIKATIKNNYPLSNLRERFDQ